MAKLLEDPEISPLPSCFPCSSLPRILWLTPSAVKCARNKTYESLKKKGDTSKVHQGFTVADMLNFFKTALDASIATAPENQAVLSYVAEICITLNDCNNFKAE
jgi:hypothetical protein